MEGFRIPGITISSDLLLCFTYQSSSQDSIFWKRRITNMNDSSILIIDDDSDIVSLTKAVLTRAGFNVFGTTDPEEAIRLVETDPSIKLVLSDISMPKLSGPEVVRRALKTRDGDVRVLFMSGGCQDAHFRQTDRFLYKPLMFESLAEEIRSTLTKPPVPVAWDGLERRRRQAHG